MSITNIDLAELFQWYGYFPHPDWESLQARVEAEIPPEQHDAAWNDIVRQWLERIAAVYAGHYQVEESHHFLIVAPAHEFRHLAALKFAEQCRNFLLEILPGIAAPPGPGKLPIIVLHDRRTYYDYIGAFFEEGTWGESSGVYIRAGYPHIVLWSPTNNENDCVIAHELTHACLTDASLPLWIEEGLAQIVEHDMTGRNLLIVTPEMAQKHKAYWREHGLECFWGGEGFQQLGDAQELSYQLAEILLRLLLDDHRPRWFGLVRKQQQTLLSFLKDAEASDCGEAAAKDHLGCSLNKLASRFLGESVIAEPR